MNNINQVLILITISLVLLVLTPAHSQNKENCSRPTKISIDTSRMSFFQLDSEGNDTLDKNGIPFRSKDEKYRFKRKFSSTNTAFIVIDPWKNSPSDFLNRYFGEITDQYILPLITKAAIKGFPVYIFTNNCAALPKPYSCDISKRFYHLATKYTDTKIIFWQELKAENFEKMLKDKGISKLIYVGFASNMCVISRPIGMIPMKNVGFSIYFVPKASAAIETRNTWESQTIHKAMTRVMSQWLAEIINYSNIYKALSVKQ